MLNILATSIFKYFMKNKQIRYAGYTYLAAE